LNEGGIVFNVKEFKKRGYQVKLLKKKKFQGYVCEVWRLRINLRGTDHNIEIWVSKELDNIPLKIVSQNSRGNRLEMTLSHIEKTQVQASLFEYPEGYNQYQPKIMTVDDPKAFMKEKEKKAKEEKKSQAKSKKQD